MNRFVEYRHLTIGVVTLIAIMIASGWLTGIGADDRVSVPDQWDAGAGAFVVVPITAVSEFGVDSVTFRLAYPADSLTPMEVYTTTATRRFELEFDIDTPGQITVQLKGSEPIFGSNDVAWILFRNGGAEGEESSLELYDALLNGSEMTTLEHGWLTLGVGQTTLSFPPDLVGGPGTAVTAPLVADPADGILGMLVVVEFDSTVLQFVSANTTPISSGFNLLPNLVTDDRLFIALSTFGLDPLVGTGPIFELNFVVEGNPGQSTPLDLVSADINEGAISATLVDGLFVVCDDSDQDNDGFSLCDADCDDGDELSFPGNPEIGCDGRDNDCDAGTPDVFDGDLDGAACDVDCDDDDDQSFPGNPEVGCDGRDNDCDGGTPDVLDGDLDGAACDIDCDDDDDQSFPGNPEVGCDGRDNDCDGGTPDVLDGDLDLFACDVDCNDGNPDINPGAEEICDGEDNDCDTLTDNVPAPLDLVAVLGEGSTAPSFSWGSVDGATGYDVVRGVLSDLSATEGDFGVATETCLADDTPQTTVDDPDDPPSSEGFWYIMRAVNCGGNGTYDSGGSSQAGGRDAETELSPNACP